MSAAARSRASRGCSRASSSVSQSAATGAPKTLAVPVDHRGHPHGRERVAHRARLLVGAHEYGDVARPDGHAVDRRRAAEEARHVRRQIGDDQLARGPDDRHVSPRRGGQAVAGSDPHAHRRAERPAAQPPSGPRAVHGVHDDPLVAERGAAEHRSSPASSGSSLRWLAASVACCSAVRVASRYVTTSAPRNA